MLAYTHVLPVLVGALLLDAVIGDPAWLYRRVPHPVALIGGAVLGLERILYGEERGRRTRGVILVILVAGGATLAGIAIAWALRATGSYWALIAEAVIAGTLIAGRDLIGRVAAVADGLESGMEQGHAAVRHIVGRDPETLDAPGVARAAIESAAENLSDAVVAPALWYLLLGLPGLLAYKAVNTLDSMVGYRNDRYRDFGWAAARLDDVANLVPARLTAFLFVLTAFFVPGASARNAFATARRDARRHISPNAGWPEAAAAGALGLRLGGPRAYGGERTDDPWLGDGRADAGPGDIRRANTLCLAAMGVLALVLLAALAATFTL